MKTLRRVGRPKAGEENDSNRSISAGAGPAYLAARLRREDPAQIEAVIRDDPEALVMYREAMLGQEGGDKRSQAATTTNIVRGGVTDEHGNSRAYSLSRVQRECDAPTVAAVMAGEMGRAEQIGRKRPVSVTRTSKTPGFSKFWFR
jgi:hypothetical protein